MQHPAKIRLTDYTYVLPEQLIAQYPLANRDQARLLVYKNRRITEDMYANIAGYIPKETLLLFNDTKVVEARLLFKKPTGGIIEIFALEPHDSYAHPATAMQQKEQVLWKCLIGGAGKWKHGQVMHKQAVHNGKTILLQAAIAEKHADCFVIKFSWDPGDYSFADILHLFGVMPIPPYLKRQTDASDNARYQTIYAKQAGSVAAPTAGLHFTAAVFDTMDRKHISREFITLHVGAGTFMPVKSELLRDHVMHGEFIEVRPALLQRLADHARDIIAVGTTSLRALESVYWMGVKCCMNPDAGISELEIKQWEVYETLNQHAVPVQQALAALLIWMERFGTDKMVVKTQLLIAPGYQVKMIRGLITNFHQPDSTLLLLVAALTGSDWSKIYDYAIAHNFRFLSYGDGCLLLPD